MYPRFSISLTIVSPFLDPFVTMYLISSRRGAQAPFISPSYPLILLTKCAPCSRSEQNPPSTPPTSRHTLPQAPLDALSDRTVGAARIAGWRARRPRWPALTCREGRLDVE